MPGKVEYEEQRLPASYANFYIANGMVLVPTYGHKKNDARALDILQREFPDRKVIGVNSVELIWGLRIISLYQPAGTAVGCNMENGAEKYRLFVAIHVPDAVKARLVESQRELKTAAGDSVRWTSPEQLHLTLLFLGNVEVSELGNLQRAFENASREGERMRLSLEGLGCFPNARRPRVIWAGVQGDVDKLKALQMELQKRLQPWCEKEESRDVPATPDVGESSRRGAGEESR